MVMRGYRKPSREALELAKRNVVEHYAVIGLLEELETFYGMLQSTVPHIFDGIEVLYKKQSKFRFVIFKHERALLPPVCNFMTHILILR